MLSQLFLSLFQPLHMLTLQPILVDVHQDQTELHPALDAPLA